MKEFVPIESSMCDSNFITKWKCRKWRQRLRFLFKGYIYVVEKEFRSEKSISIIPVLESVNTSQVTPTEPERAVAQVA